MPVCCPCVGRGLRLASSPVICCCNQNVLTYSNISVKKHPLDYEYKYSFHYCLRFTGVIIYSWHYLRRSLLKVYWLAAPPTPLRNCHRSVAVPPTPNMAVRCCERKRRQKSWSNWDSVVDFTQSNGRTVTKETLHQVIHYSVFLGIHKVFIQVLRV